MDEELVKTLKYLRLGGLIAHWDEYLSLARKKRYSAIRLLEHVLEEECRIKRANAHQIRLKKARIPEHLVMETFPFSRQPKLNKKRVLSLYDSLDFVQKNQNIIWIGPTGCGKTGLASSFLIQAIHRGCKGRYVLFPEAACPTRATDAASGAAPAKTKNSRRFIVILLATQKQFTLH